MTAATTTRRRHGGPLIEAAGGAIAPLAAVQPETPERALLRAKCLAWFEAPYTTDADLEAERDAAGEMYEAAMALLGRADTREAAEAT